MEAPGYHLLPDDTLLAQCEVETHRASGPGGQKVNKTDSAVRLRHTPTGLVVNMQRERSQTRNKAEALRVLRHRLAVLAHVPKERFETRVPRSVKLRILDAKRRRASIKSARRKPGADD
ncbi:MAG: peptide chain release factor-like protein [Candidatus Sumerlaeia bacterium]|nr:peptide chain release factor-like protein [Candidatus Sumerlaeia bacterium]